MAPSRSGDGEHHVCGRAQVLPAHYAPFWEALLNCTWPFLLACDWKIEPDAPGNYKQMY
jgi:hypothetical protein